MIVMAPVSVGELIDKITILEIKQERIQDLSKLDNIHRELDELTDIFKNLQLLNVDDLTNQLKLVNEELWDIENFKRACESKQQFDQEFVEYARQVYLKNDLRASLKREINIACGSTIVEEKSYIKDK